MIDRRLYLPKRWAEDPARRAKAHVPDDVLFATKPAMAREMVARILDEGAPCAFMLADALYGSDYQFRRMLEQRRQAYVLAIRSNHVLRFLEEWRFVQTDPATLVGDLEAQAWQPLSAGEGAKGSRLYEWVRLPLNWQTEDGFARWLLARRSLRDPHPRQIGNAAVLALACGYGAHGGFLVWYTRFHLVHCTKSGVKIDEFGT
nr:transposase [Phyllobacterium phragmitis]